MSALDQYIRLYRDNAALIDRHAAPLFNTLRPRALECVVNCMLPVRGTEDYEHTDLDAMLAPDYGLNVARVPMDVSPADSFRCEVPNMSTAMFFALNDMYVRTTHALDCLPAGVVAGSLSGAASEHPELLGRYYGALADMSNPLVALNTLLAQDGFLLYVPDGVKVEKPIQLVNILQHAMPLMAVRRILVILGRDAEARLLVCDHTQSDSVRLASLQTVEIFAGENSRFDYYDLEESTASTSRMCSLYLRQERGSNVLVDGITLYNGVTRNEYFCRFAASDASLRLLGMAIEDRGREVATHSLISHDVPGCHSDELFKYVVDDESRGSFSGRIYVAPHAVKTEAYQSNRNIVGSDSARMFSKPQLEIYNDDVKCSHGTATGQLDPMQIFYMRTRGLTEQTARLLLKQAFMADVIDGVRMPALRDRLQHLVERRFSGAAPSCASCRSCDRPTPDLGTEP